MPIYTPTGFLDITNATLRTSNLEAENFKLNGGNIYVTTDFTTPPTLQLIAGFGNVTSNTIQFSNDTTGLVTTANVSVGKDLTVAGDINFSGTFNQNGAPFPPSPWITTGVDISYTTGNVSVGKDLTVTGNALVSSNLTVTGNVSVSDDLTVTGNALVSSNLTVAGNALVSDDLTVTGNALVSSNLTVAGNVSVSDDLTVTGNVSVSDDLTVTGNVSVSDDLTVTGNVLISDDLTVTGNALVSSNLTVAGNVSVSDDLTVTGNVAVSGTGAILVPSGTTAQQPTGINGMIRYNTETGYMEAYTGSGWGSIATPPTIQTFSPTSVAVADVNTQVFAVTGAFFDAITNIQLQGSNGTKYDVTDFTFTNSGSIGFKMGTLATGQAANRPFHVVVTNGAGLSGTSTATIGLGAGVSWTSPAAGATLATFLTGTAANNTELAATDDLGGSGVIFSVPANNLPSPLTLNGITGAITGIIGAVTVAGGVSVTFRATDTVTGTTLDRTFSIVGMDGLFAFTSHTFTRAVGDVRFGPTFDQMKTAYNSTVWYNTTAWFNQVSGKQGFQLWTIPKTGTYRITAKGGQGTRTAGNGAYSNSPGNGANIRADIAFTVGTKIVIIVGQAGEYPTSVQKNNTGGGGGGATWILKESFTTANDQVYMVAGGGGGAGSPSYNIGQAGHANGSSQGNFGYGGSAGGTFGGASGGAGWLGNGTASSNGSSGISEGIRPAAGAMGGGAGGNSSYPGYESTGGFGGGGGNGIERSGGGAGATGGAGGEYNASSYGGISYITTTATNRTFTGTHTAYEGSVYIQAPGTF